MLITTVMSRPVVCGAVFGSHFTWFSVVNSFLSALEVMVSNLFFQHPFVTQLLTRNLLIELLDMANNPELHHTHADSMDDSDLEVSSTERRHAGQQITFLEIIYRLITWKVKFFNYAVMSNQASFQHKSHSSCCIQKVR